MEKKNKETLIRPSVSSLKAKKDEREANLAI